VGLIAGEVVCRIHDRMLGNRAPIIVDFSTFAEKAWFEPHPYLVYVFKPNISFVKDKFDRGHFQINSFGFRSTLEFDVHDLEPAPNTFRVAVLGGSTTMGVNDNDEVWPYLLGEYLRGSIGKQRVEILNEGTMGYTSLDNLIDLSIRIVDFDCDCYVLYLGINDYLAEAPPDVFRTDHAHFRRTLWENLHFSLVEILPPPFLRSKLVQRLLLLFGIQDRRDLLKNTNTQIFRSSHRMRLLQGTREEQAAAKKAVRDSVVRNVASMVGVIRAHRPDAIIVLSSFYHVGNPQYIQELNQALQAFAQKTNIAFANPAETLPHNKSMAFDYGHFTPKGDREMANVFGAVIVREREKALLAK